MSLTQSEINAVMQQLQPIIAKAMSESTSIAQAQANIQQGVTQYIGARYVPMFADPIVWDSTRPYEPLTIVLYQGNSFTTRQYTPAGIDIANAAFWAQTGNYNAQIELYRREIKPQHFETLSKADECDRLVSGNIVITLGKFAAGDNGGCTYLLDTAFVPNSENIITINGIPAKIIDRVLSPEMFYPAAVVDNAQPYFSLCEKYSDHIAAHGNYTVTSSLLFTREHLYVEISNLLSKVKNAPTIIFRSNYSQLNIGFINFDKTQYSDQQYSTAGCNVGVRVECSYSAINIAEMRRFTCGIEFCSEVKPCVFNVVEAGLIFGLNGIAFNNISFYTNGNIVKNTAIQVDSSAYAHGGVLSRSANNYITNANHLEFSLESAPNANNVFALDLKNARGWNVEIIRCEINVDDNANNVINVLSLSDTTYQNHIVFDFNWNYYVYTDSGVKNKVKFLYYNNSEIAAVQEERFYSIENTEWNAKHDAIRVRNLVPFVVATNKADNSYDAVQCLPLSVVGDSPALRFVFDKPTKVFARFLDATRNALTDAVRGKSFYEYSTISYPAAAADEIREPNARVTKGILSVPNDAAFVEIYINANVSKVEMYSNNLVLDSNSKRYFQPWADMATNVSRINA